MSRTRVERPVRRMGTEVMADRRTRRQRTRAAEEQAAIEAELDEKEYDPWEDYSNPLHPYRSRELDSL